VLTASESPRLRRITTKITTAQTTSAAAAPTAISIHKSAASSVVDADVSDPGAALVAASEEPAVVDGMLDVVGSELVVGRIVNPGKPVLAPAPVVTAEAVVAVVETSVMLTNDRKKIVGDTCVSVATRGANYDHRKGVANAREDGYSLREEIVVAELRDGCVEMGIVEANKVPDRPVLPHEHDVERASIASSRGFTSWGSDKQVINSVAVWREKVSGWHPLRSLTHAQNSPKSGVHATDSPKKSSCASVPSKPPIVVVTKWSCLTEPSWLRYTTQNPPPFGRPASVYREPTTSSLTPSLSVKNSVSFAD
jgi:hypothetical protein